MKHEEKLSMYLERARNLLDKGDKISLIYCALELRKVIELIVWTQFKDCFREYITQNLKRPFLYYDFVEKFQDKSISKMYDMLKKYSPGYSERAQNKNVETFLSSFGNAELQEVGKTCYIPGELINRYYKYLSELLHYEKEFYPDNFTIDSSKLEEIYSKVEFIKKNYTIRLLMEPDKYNSKNILDDFKKLFNFDPVLI